MRDVADRANVSLSTVSFVVNGTKHVAPATRTRVEAAMAELGFTRNLVARALASRRTRILALLFPAFDDRLNSIGLRFVEGAAAAAAARGYHLVLWPDANDSPGLASYLAGGLVDGVLAMEVELDDPRVPVLDEARIPYVLIGRTRDPTGYAYADVDFAGSATTALERLAGLGHERIALLLERPRSPGPSEYGPLARVERAFGSFAAAHGMAPTVLRCDRTPGGGRAAAAELQGSFPSVTAVLVMNETAAPGLVGGLQAAGLDVPGDVSVVALGMSSQVAEMTTPVLDHLVPPGGELGRVAADALIARLDDPDTPPISALLPCYAVPGGTVAAPSRRPASTPA